MKSDFQRLVEESIRRYIDENAWRYRDGGEGDDRLFDGEFVMTALMIALIACFVAVCG